MRKQNLVFAACLAGATSLAMILGVAAGAKNAGTIFTEQKENQGIFVLDSESIKEIDEGIMEAVALDDSNNKVNTRFTGVFKNDDGRLEGKAGEMMTFTNLDPIRALDGISITLNIKSESPAMIVYCVAFSYYELSAQDLAQGTSKDQTIHVGSNSFKGEYNLVIDQKTFPEMASARYVYMASYCEAAPVEIKGMSYSTPCAEEPASTPLEPKTNFTKKELEWLGDFVEYVPYHPEISVPTKGQLAAVDLNGDLNLPNLILGKGFDYVTTIESYGYVIDIYQLDNHETQLPTLQVARIGFAYSIAYGFMPEYGYSKTFPLHKVASVFGQEAADSLPNLAIEGASYQYAFDADMRYGEVGVALTDGDIFANTAAVEAYLARFDLDRFVIEDFYDSIDKDADRYTYFSISLIEALTGLGIGLHYNFSSYGETFNIVFKHVDVYSAFPYAALNAKFADAIAHGLPALPETELAGSFITVSDYESTARLLVNPSDKDALFAYVLSLKDAGYEITSQSEISINLTAYVGLQRMSLRVYQNTRGNYTFEMYLDNDYWSYSTFEDAVYNHLHYLDKETIFYFLSDLGYLSQKEAGYRYSNGSFILFGMDSDDKNALQAFLNEHTLLDPYSGFYFYEGTDFGICVDVQDEYVVLNFTMQGPTKTADKSQISNLLHDYIADEWTYEYASPEEKEIYDACYAKLKVLSDHFLDDGMPYVALEDYFSNFLIPSDNPAELLDAILADMGDAGFVYSTLLDSFFYSKNMPGSFRITAESTGVRIIAERYETYSDYATKEEATKFLRDMICDEDTYAYLDDEQKAAVDAMQAKVYVPEGTYSIRGSELVIYSDDVEKIASDTLAAYAERSYVYSDFYKTYYYDPAACYGSDIALRVEAFPKEGFMTIATVWDDYRSYQTYDEIVAGNPDLPSWLPAFDFGGSIYYANYVSATSGGIEIDEQAYRELDFFNTYGAILRDAGFENHGTHAFSKNGPAGKIYLVTIDYAAIAYSVYEYEGETYLSIAERMNDWQKEYMVAPGNVDLPLFNANVGDDWLELFAYDSTFSFSDYAAALADAGFELTKADDNYIHGEIVVNQRLRYNIDVNFDTWRGPAVCINLVRQAVTLAPIPAPSIGNLYQAYYRLQGNFPAFDNADQPLFELRSGSYDYWEFYVDPSYDAESYAAAAVEMGYKIAYESTDGEGHYYAELRKDGDYLSIGYFTDMDVYDFIYGHEEYGDGFTIPFSLWQQIPELELFTEQFAFLGDYLSEMRMWGYEAYPDWNTVRFNEVYDKGNLYEILEGEGFTYFFEYGVDYFMKTVGDYVLSVSIDGDFIEMYVSAVPERDYLSYFTSYANGYFGRDDLFSFPSETQMMARLFWVTDPNEYCAELDFCYDETGYANIKAVLDVSGFEAGEPAEDGTVIYTLYADGVRYVITLSIVDTFIRVNFDYFDEN